jgi:signal transduction histidine kinase
MNTNHRLEHQLHLLQSQMLPGSIGTCGLVCVFIYFFWGSVNNHTQFALWAAAAMITTTVNAVYMQLIKIIAEPEEQRKSLYTITFLGFITGIVWSYPSLLIFELDLTNSDDLFRLVFIIMSVLGMVTAALGAITAYLPMYYCSIAPFVISLVSVCFQVDDLAFSLQGIASIVLIYSGAVFSFAFVINKRLLESIDLRQENLELAQNYKIEKEKAEQANLAKSRFLASASHDLRQPLYALGLYSEALKGERDPLMLERLYIGINKTTGSLRLMLNTILDLSKIQADAVFINKQEFAVQDAFDMARENFAQQALDKGLQLNFAPSSLWLYSDISIINRILWNLISNAIRYTEKGKILVGVRCHAEQLSIQVLDTGIGIESTHQTKMFDEYFQVANTERDVNHGLGLGLSIVKGLAISINAKLEWSSTLGRGSQFSIVLPNWQRKEVIRNIETEPANISGNILIIDDDVEILSAANIIFNRWSLNVRCAENLEQAKVLISEGYKPDVILSDYRLRDGVTGVQLLDQLIDIQTLSCQGLLITGETGVEQLQDIVQSGYLLLHKPLDPEQLHESIKQKLALVKNNSALVD